MVVRVSKRRWLRGGEGGDPALLRGSKMCCLGFAARQLGQTCKEIRGLSMPGDIPEDDLSTAMVEGPFLLERATLDGPVHRDSSLSLKASAINDDGDITDAVRMRRLRALFKESGHKIVFVP